MHFSLRFVFLVLLALFLTSACLGALISYNPSLAWSRFTAIAVGVGLCVLFAVMPEKIRAFNQDGFPLMRAIFAFLPTLFILYFVLTNDWTARLGKITWLDPVLHWFVTVQPRLLGLVLDSNSFGGALAMLIPLQIAALWFRRVTERIITMVLLLVSLLGLVVSASRGAWIAFGLVAWVAAMWLVLARIMPGWQSGRTRIAVWVALITYLTLTIGIAIMLTPLGALLLNEGGGHWLVARNSLDLVSDYPFTGIGLGAFTMAYSSYILLVHVPHTIHAHNLFLDLWLEQGLLGLLAFVGLIVVGVLNAPEPRWRIAALASLGVMLVHGLLDDAFYGYGAGALALLLIPLGMLARDSASAMHLSRWFAPVFASVIAIIALFAVLVPTTRAMIEANLGALSQTRAELSIYEWSKWSFQDQLRRSGEIDLAPAVAHYQTALALRPTNAIANRRLGQIELSLGRYDSARRYLSTAYASAPDHPATRLLLGELFAIDGQPGQAVALWQSLDMTAKPLQVRLWWYEYIGDQTRLAKLSYAVETFR